ncbi:MAG: M20/M25/M40 family metallo-hydrolase [Leptospiraceae bacterium]|nr:M20 family peptidase [Leptospiraceae bacterium]MCP5512624.1 M20/M25/M40 family metallo-hydrolase [Leptospiraceae bacterium]
MKKVISIAIILLIFLTSILLTNLLFFPSKQIRTEAISPEPISIQPAIKRLSEAIQIKTVSNQEKPIDRSEFLKFQKFLNSSYPLVSKNLSQKTFLEYSLLYEWKGTDPSLKPILFMSHMDVVPVENEENWEAPPFSGSIDENFVRGRGSLDDKSAVLANFESIEFLLSKGYKPKRTVYLSIGHDEETIGRGASAIAEYFQTQNIEFELIQDEGMFLADGFLPGITKPVAIIGIAQKGYVTLELTVTDSGGHSSSPPNPSAVGILSRALVSLEENQMPGKLRGVIKMMFDTLGPEMANPFKLLFANQWIFSPLIESQLSSSPGTNSNLRTTTALTMLKGSEKENVLPQKAQALVNFRINPSDSIAKVVEHVKNVVDNPRVEIRVLEESAKEPSPISSTESDTYQLISRTVREIFPEAIVTPGIFIASSDTFAFVKLSKNIFRFHPLYIKKSLSDEKRIHGNNERISIKDYEKFIQYNIRFIQNCSEK